MSAATILILLAAPAATLYPLLFCLTAPWRGAGAWWRSPIGRALMTKAMGLALLIDLALLHRVVEPYPGQEAVRLVVFSLIVAGVWMALGALIYEKHKASRAVG